MSETETAAAYIRVSTEQQKEEDSHIRQRDRMQQWADDHGTDVEFFEDIAISGQSDERDAYDELLDSYHDYDYVVVRELSRFGRDPVAVLQDVEDIAESDGTEFVSVTEPMLDTTSAHGKLMIRLIASINGFHADLRREQAQRMVERRIQDREELSFATPTVGVEPPRTGRQKTVSRKWGVQALFVSLYKVGQ